MPELPLRIIGWFPALSQFLSQLAIFRGLLGAILERSRGEDQAVRRKQREHAANAGTTGPPARRGRLTSYETRNWDR